MPKTHSLTLEASTLADLLAIRLKADVDTVILRALNELFTETLIVPKAPSVAEKQIDALVHRFLAEKCAVGDGFTAANAVVYAMFNAWSGEAYSHKRLTQSLNRAGFNQRNVPATGREWIGFHVKAYTVE